MKYPDIFNPDLSRVGTRESQMYNLVAGELMTRVVRTALGPRGMTKVYVDILGEETVTKHGGAFLRKVDVDHPAAKAVVDAVNSVDNHVGDGTVTAAVLLGALLKHAGEMRGRRVPTAAIIAGYERAAESALGRLRAVRFERDPADRGVMGRLARCCMDGKALAHFSRDRMAGMLVDAACYAAGFGADDNGRGRQKQQRQRGACMPHIVDNVKIEEKPGNISQTELVPGTVIDKPVDGDAMPRAMHNARILLLNEPLERTRIRTESEIAISEPGQAKAFLARESEDVRRMVDCVAGCGANVVISRKGIDDESQEALARRGIMSVRRVKYNDLWWLEKSTGASTCAGVGGGGDVPGIRLGYADRVYERDVGGDRMIFVESRGDPRSVTLLLRANSKRYLDELHRTALNVLHVLRGYVECPYLVYGGGSCEALLARHVRAESVLIEGKAQVAAARFADALESIPVTLAENAGMAALDVLPLLRSLVYGGRSHGGLPDCSDDGGSGNGSGARNHEPIPGCKGWYGIDCHGRRVCDVSLAGDVVEPYVVKEQVVKSAAEAACSILNVDDVFVKDLIDNTHCHIDGTVHAHKDPGRGHSHWEQEGLEQRQMHHYY